MRIEKDGVVVEKTTNDNTVVEAKTAKCPECGGKYLPETGYCPSCKKKVSEPKKKKENVNLDSSTEKGSVEIIEIPEEVKIPGTDIILEKGDKIEVLKTGVVVETEDK